MGALGVPDTRIASNESDGGILPTMRSDAGLNVPKFVGELPLSEKSVVSMKVVALAMGAAIPAIAMAMRGVERFFIVCPCVRLRPRLYPEALYQKVCRRSSRKPPNAAPVLANSKMS